MPYPEALGVWPAVRAAARVRVDRARLSEPCRAAVIAWLALAYSILTFTGMFLFGCERWLAHGEVFSLVFGTFARFAPIEIRTGPGRGLWLRPFGAGLIDSSRPRPR